MTRGPKPRSAVDRAMAKVAIDPSSPDGCWIWHGCRDRLGYGHLYNKGGTKLAHKIIYEATFGPVPDGLELDHFLCRNPSCVNPRHLEPVSHQENIRRALETQQCPAGHSYAVHGRIASNGRKYCSECNRERARVNYDKRRSPVGPNSAKTHCVHGHPFSEENTYWRGGYRDCRECVRRRGREYKSRLRVAS